MLNYLYDFDLTSLFVDELGWDYPSNNEIELTIENQKYLLRSLAEKRGFVIYECHIIDVREIPNRAIRRKIGEVSKEYTYEHLLIFTSPEYTKQIWHWSRKVNNESIYSEYLFEKRKDNSNLLTKISSLFFDIVEESSLNIFKVIQRVQDTFGNLEYSVFVLPEKPKPKISRSTYFSLAKQIIKLSIPYRIVEINYDFEYISKMADVLDFDEEVRNYFAEILQIRSQIFSWDELINMIRENANDLFASLSHREYELLQFKYGIDDKEYYEQDNLDELYDIDQGYLVCKPLTTGLTYQEYDNAIYQDWENNESTVLTDVNNYNNINQQLDIEFDNVLDVEFDDDNEVNPVEVHFDPLQEANKLNSIGIELLDSLEYEAALIEFNKAIILNSSFYEAFYNRGVTLKELKQYNEAISSHIKAFEIASSDFDMPYEISRCYALQSKVKKSVEYLKIAIAASPEVYINQARSDSDFDLIRDCPSFKALVISDEEKAYELYKQAQERMIYGEYDKAIMSFGKFLKLQPDHAEALYEIAGCYASQNKVQKAVEYLTKAIALFPDRYLAKARTDSNFELIRHRSSFKSLVSSDEEKANDLYSQAKVMMATEDYKQAITIYNKALKIQPDNAKSLLDKGFALFKLERYEEALENLQKATGLDTKGYIWHILDSAYCQFSDHENIFTCYSKACKTNPYSPEIWYGMARIYNLRKMYVDAASCYEQALYLNPLLLPARVELSQVNEILDAERNRRIEQEKKRKAEEQKRVEQELKRKAEEQKRIEQENKQKAEEKERKKREEDRRRRERERSRDPLSQVLGFIKKIFS